MNIIQRIQNFFFDRKVNSKLNKVQSDYDEIAAKIVESRKEHEDLNSQIQALPESDDKARLLQILANNNVIISENEKFLAATNMQLHILKTTKLA